MKDYVAKHNLDPFRASFDLNCVTFRPMKKNVLSPPASVCNRVTDTSWGADFFEISAVPPTSVCNRVTDTSWRGTPMPPPNCS